MAYLNELHPEVFVINPRAGGAVKIDRPDLRIASRYSSTRSVPGRRGSKTTIRSAAGRPSKVTIKTTTTGGTFDSKFFRPTAASTPKRTTREYRIKKILAASPWVLFGDDEEPDNPLPPDPIHDAMTILSVSISTIMLMAAGYKNIPRDHLLWTMSYLECVKDDYGNHPPNVRGVMNNLKLIDSTLTSFFDELDEDTKSELTGGMGFTGGIQTIPMTTTSANTPPVEAPVEAPAEAPAELPSEAE